jgi:hypothetical protein
MVAIPTRTKEEMVALVDETVAFYGANPRGRRATDAGNTICFYYDSGCCCAVGRALINPAAMQRSYPNKRIDQIDEEINNLQLLFKPEYRGYSIGIWRRLQVLHDSPMHWNESGGLTAVGQRSAEGIKVWINSNRL